MSNTKAAELWESALPKIFERLEEVEKGYFDLQKALKDIKTTLILMDAKVDKMQSTTATMITMLESLGAVAHSMSDRRK